MSEIGWMVLPEFQGRGIAKTAVRMLLELAGEQERWGLVHAFPGDHECCFQRRLPVGRIQFRRRTADVLRGTPVPHQSLGHQPRHRPDHPEHPAIVTIRPCRRVRRKRRRVAGTARNGAPASGALSCDIREVDVTDVLIRDVPDDVIAALDARAGRLGLSRSEYVRRRAGPGRGPARLSRQRPGPGPVH